MQIVAEASQWRLVLYVRPSNQRTFLLIHVFGREAKCMFWINHDIITKLSGFFLSLMTYYCISSASLSCIITEKTTLHLLTGSCYKFHKLLMQNGICMQDSWLSFFFASFACLCHRCAALRVWVIDRVQKDRNLNHNGGIKKSQPSLFDDRTAVDLNEILISITYQWQPFLHIRCLLSEVKRSSTQREIT